MGKNSNKKIFNRILMSAAVASVTFTGFGINASAAEGTVFEPYAQALIRKEQGTSSFMNHKASPHPLICEMWIQMVTELASAMSHP